MIRKQVNHKVIVPAAVMIETLMTTMVTLYEDRAIAIVLNNFTILVPLFLACIGKPQRMAIEMGLNGKMKIFGDETQVTQRGKLHCSGNATSLPGAPCMPDRLTSANAVAFRMT